MIKSRLDRYLGRNVYVTLKSNDVKIGLLELLTKYGGGYSECRPCLYTITSKTGERITIRASDVRKCTEVKRHG